VPGLISVDVLIKTSLACGWVMETVEIYMYPGSGQFLTTNCTVRDTSHEELSKATDP
jgi:hypothetical protein